MRVLFVCLGNICRSPAAEAVMRHRAPNWEIDSAGTADWHRGKPPYGPMQLAARTAGYDMSALRARQLRAEDFDDFDLILGMDAENLANIEMLRPMGNATPVRNLAYYASDADLDEVPDPYYTRDFDGALRLIERCVDGLLAQSQS